MFDITRVGDNQITAFICFIIKKIDFYENVQVIKNITGNFGSHDWPHYNRIRVITMAEKE